MFILVHSDNELLKSDNEVQAFTTHEKAYAEMLDQLRDAATDEEIEFEDNLEIGDLYDVSEGIDRWCGYFYMHEAYLETSDNKWCIFELPGFFVPQEDAGWVEACLSDFDRAQTHFEASEIALDVCNMLKKYV